MTTPSTPRKAGPLLGTGAQTAWPFTFKVFAAGDVQVTTANSSGTETLLVLGTDYTVSLNANQETSPGGTVNYPISGSALPVGSVLAIIGDLDYDQPLDLPSGGNFSPTALENQLDRSTMQIQQLREEMNRTAKLPPTSSESVEELVDDLQRIADSADNLDTVANNIADVNTVADDIANVNIAAANVADINNFADVYQGAKATAPTLRNNGNALQSGDLYFDTSADRMFVYESGAWINYEAAAEAAKVAAEAARDAAQIAETNAELAEVNAELAETNAELAETNAEAAESRAEAAQALAEAAYSALVAAGAPTIYASTAAGISGTTNGQYFSVPSGVSEESLILYLNNAGVAQEVKRYPSAALLTWTNEYRRTAGSQALTEKVREPSGTFGNSVYQGLTVATNDVVDVWLTVKAAERMTVNLFNNGGAQMNVRIDLELGRLYNDDGNWPLTSLNMYPLGNGWYLVHVVKTVTAGGSGNLQFRIYGVGSAAAPYGSSSYTGDGTSGVFVDSLLVYNRTTATYPFASPKLSAASWTKLNSTVVAATLDASSAGAQIEVLDDTANEYRIGLGSSYQTKKFVEGSGSVSPSLYTSFNWTNNAVYTITAVVKKAERTKINFFSNGGALFNITFDLDTEFFSGFASGQQGSFKRLGNGWYEIAVVVVATQTSSSNLQVRMFNASGSSTYTGDGASGLFVDSVRLSSGATYSLLQSIDPRNVVWVKAGITVVGAAATSKLGSNYLADFVRAFGEATGDKFIEGSGASQSPSVYRSFTFTNGTAYTFGGDFKAGERARVNLFCNGGAEFGATFNLEDGVVESGSGASITSLGNGWYRCQQTVTATASTGANLQLRVYPSAGGHSYTGDGVSGLYANDAFLTAGGGNLLSNSANFATAWTWQNVSVASNVILFGGTEPFGGGAATPYVDPGAAAWVGKKVAAIGTSVTEQAQYTVPLAAELGCTLTNLGTSGGSIASGSHYGSLYIYNAIASIPTDSEVVTVEAGINDFGTDNSTLGALGDTTTATFYGAIFAACVAIRARATNAKIIFFTPYSGDSRTSTHRILRTNSKGHTLQQFQQAVAESAGYCGFAWIDVGRQAGIGYHTGTLYLGDGLHLNATGGARYAKYVAEQLRDLARGGYLV
jgi:lysophospholipase L1-like esterase